MAKRAQKKNIEFSVPSTRGKVIAKGSLSHSPIGTAVDAARSGGKNKSLRVSNELREMCEQALGEDRAGLTEDFPA